MRFRTMIAPIVAAVLTATPAMAQMGGGGGGGSSGGGGGGGGGSGGSASSAGTLGGASSDLNANAGIATGSLLGGFNNAGSGARSTGRGGTTAGSATVSTTNFLSTTYVNVLAQGISSSTGANATVGSNVAFGSPVYTITTTTGTTGGRTGATGMGGIGGRTGATGSGSLSTGVSFTQGGSLGAAIGRRGPVVGAGLRFAPQGRSLEQIRSEVASSLANGSRLTNVNGVTVHAIDGAVVLRGTVASEDDRRLAENHAWLTPGVRQIKNELQVK
ncbi:MAG: BON domain-containing protein [Gemmataceae bacterium]